MISNSFFNFSTLVVAGGCWMLMVLLLLLLLLLRCRLVVVVLAACAPDAGADVVASGACFCLCLCLCFSIPHSANACLGVPSAHQKTSIACIQNGESKS
ncbi:hypothetical protein HOY80DRAFT_940341 [Tuber brumale]|nr:hypothetical protein HOY80DRAFT_940341 [Tuber brumale]